VEEALLNVAREADLYEIFHKTWQAENPNFLVCLPLWLPFLPTNCGVPFTTLPESLTSLTTHLCSPACPPSPWEQKGFDGNLRNLMVIVWELDEDKSILMGTIWELDGKSSPNPFKKIRNIPGGHVCATQLAHPLKTQETLALPTCFILTCFLFLTNCLGQGRKLDGAS
jgi:hypothetical protein